MSLTHVNCTQTATSSTPQNRSSSETSRTYVDCTELKDVLFTKEKQQLSSIQKVSTVTIITIAGIVVGLLLSFAGYLSHFIDINDRLSPLRFAESIGGRDPIAVIQDLTGRGHPVKAVGVFGSVSMSFASLSLMSTGLLIFVIAGIALIVQYKGDRPGTYIALLFAGIQAQMMGFFPRIFYLASVSDSVLHGIHTGSPQLGIVSELYAAARTYGVRETLPFLYIGAMCAVSVIALISIIRTRVCQQSPRWTSWGVKGFFFVGLQLSFWSFLAAAVGAFNTLAVDAGIAALVAGALVTSAAATAAAVLPHRQAAHVSSSACVDIVV